MPYLKSKRFNDVEKFKTPELRWKFYDAFHSSAITQIAIANGENSIQNLDKYLKLGTSKTTECSVGARLPQYMNGAGKWTDFSAVKKCLGLPQWLILSDDLTDWECATAFSIAAIRQHNDLFELLRDAHDRGTDWVSSNEVIYTARELILSHLGDSTAGPEVPPALSPGMKRLSKETSTVNESQKLTIEIIPPLNDHLAVLESERSTSYSPSEYSEFSSTSPMSVSPSFQEKMRSITPQKDGKRIAACEQRINELEMDIIRLAMDLDKKIEFLMVCKDRSVKCYNDAETVALKNLMFDEFTARLGDGIGPREGYLDWRRDGVPGTRSLIVTLLCQVQRMADERLLLEELRTPEGRKVKEDYVPDGNRGRWGLCYNGQDVVTFVLHCLDSLRECRELATWYGRLYPFLGNPLTLPFSYDTAFAELQMMEKVKDQLESRAHVRVGHVQIGMEQAWQHQNYLTQWAKGFDNLCKRTAASNWPVPPSAREAPSALRMHTALVVLFCRAARDMQATVQKEKEFVKLMNTVRGKNLMKGKTGLKPDRRLGLPMAHVIDQGTEAVLHGLLPLLELTGETPFTHRTGAAAVAGGSAGASAGAGASASAGAGAGAGDSIGANTTTATISAGTTGRRRAPTASGSLVPGAVPGQLARRRAGVGLSPNATDVSRSLPLRLGMQAQRAAAGGAAVAAAEASAGGGRAGEGMGDGEGDENGGSTRASVPHRSQAAGVLAIDASGTDVGNSKFRRSRTSIVARSASAFAIAASGEIVGSRGSGGASLVTPPAAEVATGKAAPGLKPGLPAASSASSSSSTLLPAIVTGSKTADLPATVKSSITAKPSSAPNGSNSQCVITADSNGNGNSKVVSLKTADIVCQSKAAQVGDLASAAPADVGVDSEASKKKKKNKPKTTAMLATVLQEALGSAGGTAVSAATGSALVSTTPAAGMREALIAQAAQSRQVSRVPTPQTSAQRLTRRVGGKGLS